ncbi:hypothetical protein [Acinetobacter shaoyimingii]|uniref:Uncharacterized protein n=1 Tax=Acinetobacter shaoyimingii TaxID=2715164 RepID=A0A6G8RXN3_9GAMM|nr:hypothetical protein [Acinetobacter shaoyimingii]NHB57694.1 hypothetical protein [Acinetobacter shaoyimingii]QIO06610.1 hypothetical protein G8E00_11950 [Acinetobacter shaoyimingii]
MNHLKYIIPFFFLSFSYSSVEAQTPINEKAKALIFKAAGFKNHLGTWQSKCSFGALTLYQDLNGDRIPDALIKDGGSTCYPKVGVGFYLLRQDTDHNWHLMLHKAGTAKFLKTKGVNSWPDVQSVTQDKCQSIYRWNGRQYVLNRRVADGMPCQTNQKAMNTKASKALSHSSAQKNTQHNKQMLKNINHLNQSITEESKNLERMATADKISSDKSMVDQTPANQPMPSVKPKYQPPAIEVKTFQQFEEPKKSNKSLEDEIKIYKAFEHLE